MGKRRQGVTIVGLRASNLLPEGLVRLRQVAERNDTAVGWNDMSTIAVIAGYAPSLVRFRGHLLKTIADMGHTVVALAPQIDPRTRRSLHDMGVQTQEFSLDRTGHSWFRDL